VAHGLGNQLITRKDMPQSAISIGPGRLADVLAVCPLVPELVAPHGQAEYEKRLFAAPAHLILVAWD
jgi:hypothetical protein